MKKFTLTKLISGLITIIFMASCAGNKGAQELNATDATKASLTAVTSFGSNPGNLKMYTYAPASVIGNAPLVVMMHGCTQTANDVADRLEWNKLADKNKFYVLYPETNSSNNSSKCFNWFETGDIARGSGEALSIKQMVDKMKEMYAIDAARVYISGFSAGGYMTPVMMAAYPDVFAAGAAMSGGPYKCAMSMTDAFTCMSPGVSKTPAAWASLAKSGYSGYTGKYPRLIVFQGDSDYTVKASNLDELVKQWTEVHNTDQTADFSETIRNSQRKQYKNASGEVVVETFLIKGMGHATGVDVGTDVYQGGTTGAFSEDKDIYAAYYAMKFFGLLTNDFVNPTLSITSPANNYASGSSETSIVINADAFDNVGITKVDFYVNNILVYTDTTAPYSFTWNNGAATNGTYTITGVAYDAAGNNISASINIINNAGPIDNIAPVITADKAEGTYDSSVTVALSANEAAKIYYTLDGSTPTQSSSLYSSALTFTATTTLKYFAKDTAGNVSAVETKTYIINAIPYNETASGTITSHYIAGRITAAQYNDLGLGTNSTGINPGKIKYGYINSMTLYKLKSTGKWVTSQSI